MTAEYPSVHPAAASIGTGGSKECLSFNLPKLVATRTAARSPYHLHTM